ncbi:oligosaccharide MFS transporter [Vibrio sp. SCSIO 43140]|uniref:oligosaccharide MFS transporter n=1 Tax=Vibrio sp. SCSIO 43140 TaxID=2819100 RepID=UPI00207627D5|nr:oligosaccharide MFS transporter [Vibrio sp. SCSIO 43140]USD62485.1 oligosaccharide MFS transporter [Vibrio sp. SCSIO 43140]
MKTDSNKVAMGKVCLMYFFYNFFWSLSSGSLFAVWLNDRVGIDGSQIGVLFGLQTGIAVLFKPAMGYIMDKLGLKKNLLYFISVLSVLIGPFYIYVYGPLLSNEATFVPGIIVGSIYLGMLFQAGSGVIASYSDRFARCHNNDFGLVNGFGIAAWGASAILAGYLYNINPDLIFVACSVAALLMLFFAFSLRVRHLDEVDNDVLSAEKIKKEDVIKLLKNKKMWAFMTYAGTISVVFWTSMSQFTRYFISFFPTQEEGITFSSNMDGITAIFLFAVSAGVPFIIKKIGAKGSLILTAVGITSFLLMIGFAGLGEKNLYLAIVAKLLFGIVNPLLIVSVFAYIAEQFDKKVNSFTYMFGFQVINNLMTAIAAPVMGTMYDSHGFPMSYIYFGVFSAAATILALFTLSGSKKAKNQEANEEPITA